MMRTVKSIDTLTKELAALDSAELHDLFNFYYRINHQHANLTSFENFAKFLVSFDKNPFRRCEDKDFRKQMIDNLIAYTDDHMSLITAIVLLKRKFTVDEIIDNYYANVNVFENLTHLINADSRYIFNFSDLIAKHPDIKERLKRFGDTCFDENGKFTPTDQMKNDC